MDYSKWDNLDSEDEGEITSQNAVAINFPSPNLPPAPDPSAFTEADQKQELLNNPAPHLDTNSPDNLAAAMSDPTIAARPTSMTKKGSGKNRYVFEHDGHKIYEWEQNLEEVNLFISPPPIGLIGADQPFIHEETFSLVQIDESTWTFDSEENELNVVLIKAHKGETWTQVLKGRHGIEIDPITKESIKKEMMLERFQEENPGFDFRNAEFNGAVPEARDFMGGVRYE